MCVLQNCCTRSSFVFEGILINCHTVTYFPFIVSGSKLGGSCERRFKKRSSLLPYSIQSSYGSTKKKRAHAYSLSFYLHARSNDSWVLLFNIIQVFNDLLRQLLAIIYINIYPCKINFVQLNSYKNYLTPKFLP